LFACQVVGNGGVAACFPEGTTYNPLLLDASATVEVKCGSGVRNDGSVIIPVIFSASGAIEGANKGATDSQSSKAASDELESTFKLVSDQVADFKSKLAVSKKR